MELTLDSAFSTGGMVGHLSYLLLVLSMLMRVMWVLRVLVIASALVAISYDFIWLKDPIGVFWESLLVLVNIAQLSITYAKNRYERFTPTEAGFVNQIFPGLSNTLKRKILDAGTWREGRIGQHLTAEGVPVDHLIYLAKGEVEVTVNAHVVGHCHAGDLIGEMTALTGAPATGTAQILTQAQYWTIPSQALRDLVAHNEEINQAVQASFHRSMLTKLVAANQKIEAFGGTADQPLP